MGRSPCCAESGLKKGPWTPEEDDKLVKYVQKHGHGSWRALPKLAGLNRCGKSCRLRWTNYLRPDIKRGKFSQDEEQTILNLHSILGNKWSAIATHLPGRTDNEIKNLWNTHLKKKLIQMGFDPMTHQPRTDIFSSLPHLIALANLKELMENPCWEEQAIRLQQEAAQMAQLNQYLNYIMIQPNPQLNNYQHTTTTPNQSAFDLLNSLKSDHASILSHLEAVPQPQSESLFENSLPFSRLPDLQKPSLFVHEQGSDSFSSPVSSSSPSPPISVVVAPSSTETSVTNSNSSTTYNVGADEIIWSEFLDDPIFHEIA